MAGQTPCACTTCCAAISWMTRPTTSWTTRRLSTGAWRQRGRTARPPSDGYAWRWLAYHRSWAAQTSPQPERHQLTESLVALVEDVSWQQAHEAALSDLPALQDALEQALDAAVADDDPLGIALLVRAADALIQFGRTHQRAEPILQSARDGDLAAARHRSELLDIDDHWRHALLLAVAWLAPDGAGDEAQKLCDEVRATMGPEPALHNLVNWVRANFVAKGDAAKLPLPCATPEGGRGADRGARQARRRPGLQPRADHQPRPGPGRAGSRPAATASAGSRPDPRHLPGHCRRRITPPFQGGTGPEQGIYPGAAQSASDANTEAGRSTTRYLAELDGPYLITYAAQHPEEGMAALERYLSVYGNYSYPEYRYSTLWLLLGYVTQYPRSDGGPWVQKAVEQILSVALGGPSVDFEQGLPIAVTALRAHNDDNARAPGTGKPGASAHG